MGWNGNQDLYGDHTKRLDWGAIAREYRMGATLKELGAKHGISENAVSNNLKKRGVLLRPSVSGESGKSLRKPGA